MSDMVAIPEAAIQESLELRSGDLAVLVDLTGIRRYVFGSSNGAGALDRVRARSFKVTACARLVTRRIQQDLVPELRTVYAAGGRQLLAGPARGTAEPILASFQRNLDEWAMRQMRGELQVHLVTARCENERIPLAALEDKLALRRQRPMEGALLQGAYWNTGMFWNPANAAGHGTCSACRASDTLHEDVCLACLEDQELGRALHSARAAHWVAESGAQVSIPGLGLALGESGDLNLESGDFAVPRHTASDLADLEEAHSGRRQPLACLVVDTDGAGTALAECKGDPQNSGDLSRSLQDFFSRHVEQLLESRFPSLYLVYGGGDDLLALGPWGQALEFAVQLRRDFDDHTASEMTFSAGLAPVHPSAPLRLAVEQAKELLQQAKRHSESGNAIALLGKVTSWDEAGRVDERGRQVARWLKEGRLSGQVLRSVVALQRLATAGQNGWKLRYLPLLAGQARRVAGQEIRDWLQRLSGSPEWPCLDLIAEMALLASGKSAAARKS